MPPLSSLEINQTAYIRGINLNLTSQQNAFRTRLLKLGFIPGREVRVIQKEPNRPLMVRIDNDNPLLLARELACDILIEPIQKSSHLEKYPNVGSILKNLLNKILTTFKPIF